MPASKSPYGTPLSFKQLEPHIKPRGTTRIHTTPVQFPDVEIGAVLPDKNPFTFQQLKKTLPNTDFYLPDFEPRPFVKPVGGGKEVLYLRDHIMHEGAYDVNAVVNTYRGDAKEYVQDGFGV